MRFVRRRGGHAPPSGGVEELRDREIIPKSIYDQISERLTVR